MGIIQISLVAILLFVGVSSYLSKTTHAPVAQPTATSNDPTLRIVNFRCDEAPGFAITRGEVQNLTQKPIRNLMAVASLYAIDGTYITSDTALVEYNPLLPGQTSPYAVYSTHNPAMSKCKVNFKTMMGPELLATR